jgi:hypothetical protein
MMNSSAKPIPLLNNKSFENNDLTNNGSSAATSGNDNNLNPGSQNQTESPAKSSSAIISPKKSPSSFSSDFTLIQYVQEAIQYIKNQKQQCNVKSIFSYLKQNHNDYSKVQTLTERELMNQLELAVKDGVLSRKFGGNQKPSNASSTCNSANPSPVKSCSTSTTATTSDSVAKAQTQVEYRIPNQDQSISDRDKKDLNIILQFLMKSVAHLTKQIFKQQIKAGSSPETTADLTCGIEEICTHLSNQYKFKIDQNSDNNQQLVYDSLKEVLTRLLNKHDKIFLKEASSGSIRYKLNSAYIQEKLQSTQSSLKKDSTTSSVATPTNNSNESNNQANRIEKSDKMKAENDNSQGDHAVLKNDESQNKTENNQIIIENTNVEAKNEQNKIKIYTNNLPLCSALSKDLTVGRIKEILGIDPPYSPEQILIIESLKKPAPSQTGKNLLKSPGKNVNIHSPVCSFCLRPEKSNPLGHLDKFLTCSDCGSNGHAYCLKYPCQLADHIRDESIKWQCIECKKCNVCFSTCEGLLLCDKCDRGYHKECCVPPFTKRPKGSFVCHVCKYVDSKNNVNNSNNLNLTINTNETNTKKRKLAANKINSSINSSMKVEENLNTSQMNVSETLTPKTTGKFIEPLIFFNIFF